MLTFDELYSWVKDLPIVDWHNHLDLDMIAADEPLDSLYEVWVKTDPYKHRAMRICGEAEDLITAPGQRTSSSVECGRTPGQRTSSSVECGRILGQRTSSSVGEDAEHARWAAWMRTLPKLVGNPIFAWAKMELEFLGLDSEPYLHGRGENISLSALTPSKLLKKFNVERLCPCLGQGQKSNGRGRPLSQCQEFNGRPRPLEGTQSPRFSWDNGRPRPLEGAQSPRFSWDNGRPRPLLWTAPLVRNFPLACATPSTHFSHTLAAGSGHRRNLPHIGQDSTLVFVTFRLADSLPESGLAELRAMKEEWLRQHPEPWDSRMQSEYRSEIADKVDKWLDAGHGSCLLADERCRRIVEESLEYFNGERATDEAVRCPSDGRCSTDGDVRCPRYILHRYVVMPNHVHVLFELLKGEDLAKIVQGWKSVSSRRINAECGTQGTVWKAEYYDRLIRNAEHYQNALEYIVKNGNAAKGLARQQVGQRSTDEDVRCPSVGQRSTDEDVRCPSVGQRSTDEDVRCPRITPSLRMNAGDVVSTDELERFQTAGCRVVDISVDDTALLDTAFESLSTVASFAAAHGWTMLLHLGALRETSSRLRAAAGPAGGFAGMRAPVDPAAVARFLNRLEGSGIATDEDVRCPREGRRSTDEDVRCPGDGQRSTDGDVRCPGEGRRSTDEDVRCPGDGQRSTDGDVRCPGDGQRSTDGDVRCPSALPRTILLTLNPEAHAQLAVLAGSFNGAGMPGKVQLGPAWWWCDHEEGIRDVLEKNAAYGVLSTFVGMTTDSRSLLSFVRHDYFRRILCQWTAGKIVAGAFPDDAALLRPMLENICYRNARNMITGS